MYISLITYWYKEIRKIISITHGMWRMKVYIDMLILIIIIVIYNETKQTNRLTRTFKKCIRILHVRRAALSVKSGPRTRWVEVGDGGNKSFFLRLSLRLNVQARRANMWCTVPLREGVSGFWERPGGSRACMCKMRQYLSLRNDDRSFVCFFPLSTPARSQKHRIVIHRELNLGRSMRTSVVIC